MTLKWNLAARGLRPHRQLIRKLEQKIKKLEVHLEHFPPDAVFLQVSLGRHPRKSLFEVALTLRLPSNIVRAEKTGPDLIPVFDLAAKALLREVVGLKSELRRESKWQRTARGLGMAAAQVPA